MAVLGLAPANATTLGTGADDGGDDANTALGRDSDALGAEGNTALGGYSSATADGINPNHRDMGNTQISVDIGQFSEVRV